MDLQTYKASLDTDAPPNDISNALQALWYDAKGDWDKAHELAQQQPDPIGAWVHAYLHRVEGDESNAFQRASRPEMRRRIIEHLPECARYFAGATGRIRRTSLWWPASVLA